MHEQNEGPPGGPREEGTPPSEIVGSFVFNSTMTREKRDLFNAKLDASLDCKTKSVNTPVIMARETYSGIVASLERLQDEEEKPRSSQEHSRLRKYKLVDVDGVKKIARRGMDTLLVAKEDLFDVIQEAHVKTGHGGRKVMDKELRRSFCNVTLESINIYLELCEECHQRKLTIKPMAPKRDTMTLAGQPPDKMIKKETLQDFGVVAVEANTAKMIKVYSETQDVEGGYPPVVEDDEFREPEDPTYSPFSNHEAEEIIFEDNSTPGTDTDTIRLLMKVEKLQAELRYERRCRMLAERELRELKEMNALMMQMRHTAHELRVAMDQVRHGSDAELPTQNNDESISFITDNETENETETTLSNHIPQDDDENYLYLSEGLRVPRILYERIPQITQTTDYKKYVTALLMILFERETLATHSLGGRTNVTQDDSHKTHLPADTMKCIKPHLPADTMKCIIDHVAMKFGAPIGQIKIAIRTKLSNEDKLLKKRQGKQTDLDLVPPVPIGTLGDESSPFAPVSGDPFCSVPADAHLT